MSKTGALEPKFNPGDICLCRNNWPGIVTHHVLAKDRNGINREVVYKGTVLAVERLGEPWESRDPELLISLGEHYHKG